MNYSRETVRKSDYEVIDGRILKPFTYILTLEELENSAEFKGARARAFLAAIGMLGLGFFLPVIVGFFFAVPYMGTDCFWVNMVSDTIVSSVFCLPLSLALVAGSIPVYRKMVDHLYNSYGFVKHSRDLKIA